MGLALFVRIFALTLFRGARITATRGTSVCGIGAVARHGTVIVGIASRQRGALRGVFLLPRNLHQALSALASLHVCALARISARRVALQIVYQRIIYLAQRIARQGGIIKRRWRSIAAPRSGTLSLRHKLAASLTRIIMALAFAGA